VLLETGGSCRVGGLATYCGFWRFLDVVANEDPVLNLQADQLRPQPKATKESHKHLPDRAR
jgi:hypothetical protein